MLKSLFQASRVMFTLAQSSYLNLYLLLSSKAQLPEGSKNSHPSSAVATNSDMETNSEQLIGITYWLILKTIIPGK